MIGPKPKGFWSKLKGPNIGGNFGPLVTGNTYEVIRKFSDDDGSMHPEKEQWVFLGHSFVPYNDGLMLFIRLEKDDEWAIPLCWSKTEQAEIIDNLPLYVHHVMDDVK